MTYTEFWYDDPWLTETYRSAYNFKRKQLNEQLWLQGLYIADAVSSVFDTTKRKKYPKEPYDIYPKTPTEKRLEAEKQRKAIIEYFNNIKSRWNNGNNQQP